MKINKITRPNDDRHLTHVKLIAENAAAISDQVHSQRDKFRRLYRRLGEKLDGFPGIWNFIAECALELDRQHPEPWTDGWIETCWSIGDQILAMDDLIPAKDVVALVLKSTEQPKTGVIS